MDPQVAEEFDPMADIRLELQMPRADQLPEVNNAGIEDAMEVEEVGNMETWIEWISNARAWLENALDNHYYDRSISVSTEAWLAMAVDPELRTRFIDALYADSENPDEEFEFEFEQLAAIAHSLIQAGLVTFDQILESTEQLALAYGGKPPLGHENELLYIKGGMDLIAPVAPFLLAATGVRPLNNMTLIFSRWENVHIESLTASLRGHQVKKIELYHVTAHHLSAFCPAFPTMPNIESLSLLGSCPDEAAEHPPLVFSQPQDAAVLQSAFSSITLKKLVMHHLICDNLEAATTLFQGVAASQLKKMDMFGLKLPEGTEDMLVTALATAPLETLKFATNDGYRGKSLLRGLKETTTIKSVTIGALEQGAYIDSDDLVDFMSDGLPRTIECLILYLKNWKHGLTKLISSFAKGETGGARLRMLTLYVRDDNVDGTHAPKTAPKEFFTAVDEGSRCLEEVVVKISGKEFPWWRDITRSWCTDELRSALALNRERRIHGHRFERIQQGTTLAIRKALLKDALKHIDKTTYYGFLRRNEWHLQDLVEEFLTN